MRQFSEFEKEILKELVSDKPMYIEYKGKKNISNGICNVMKDCLNIIHVSLQADGTWIKVVFIDKGESNKIVRFFDLIFLIKYLENNFLLGLSSFGIDSDFTLSPYKEDPKFGWGISEQSQGYGKFRSILNKTYTRKTFLAKEIMQYVHSEYYPSQYLKDIVANDFKSKEQIDIETQLAEAKTQTKYARKSIRFAFITIIIAILTLLATIISPHFY